MLLAYTQRQSTSASWRWIFLPLCVAVYESNSVAYERVMTKGQIGGQYDGKVRPSVTLT